MISHIFSVHAVKYFRAAFAVQMTMITVLSLVPSSVITYFTVRDKVLHLGAYGLATVLGMLAFADRFRLALCLSLAGYGIGLEFAQGFSGRTFSVGDMVANTLGVVLAWVCLTWLERIWAATAAARVLVPVPVRISPPVGPASRRRS